MRALGYSASGNTASDDNGLGTVLTQLYDSTDRLGAAGAEYVALEGKPLAYIATGSIYWVHADHPGTPQMLTDATAAAVWDATYRPFGAATVTGALTFNLRFPGQYADAETGLHYNYFRDYDPTTGRYIQSDPIGLQGGWNTYGYVGGNPVMRVDPRGLKARVCCRKIPFAFGARHCFIDSDIGGQKAAWAVQGNTRGPASTWGEATWDDPFDDRDASDTVCGDWTDNCSVDGCVAKEVTGYPGKTVYVFQWGPNSNTFAGIVARRCDLKKPAGAWAPGWDVTSPAPPYKPYPPYSRPEK